MYLCKTNSIYNGYKILNEIGTGGFGQVYRVENIITKKIYALKLVILGSNINQIRESNILKLVDNEFILKLEDEIFNLDNNPLLICMITEYCENKSLKDKIKFHKKNDTNIDKDLVFEWTASIIKGLSYLHFKLNLMHRDIKPGNILLTKEKKIKIADFGLVRHDDSSSLSLHLGTLNYMSPEMQNNKSYNAKVDIWSTGCVLFELIFLEKYRVYIENVLEEKIAIKTEAKLAKLLEIMLVPEPSQRIDSQKLEELLTILDENNLEKLIYLNNPNYKSVQLSITLPATILPKRNHDFSGREDILSSMSEAFDLDKKQMVVLCSYAGTGKSTVANEFAYRFIKQNYCFAYWMKSDEKNLDTEYENFARQLNLLDSNQNREVLIQNVNTKIQNLDSRVRILFIFDNCDNYEIVENYIKNMPKNTIIILTTRDKSFETNDSNSFIINLDSFNENESIEFMKKSFKEKALKLDDNDFRELLKLSKLDAKIRPYVLNKLVALIKYKSVLMPLKEFIKTHKSNQVNELNVDENELFDLLYNDSSLWNILKFSAFLDPDFIPVSMYTDILQIIDETQLIVAIEKFNKLSIINIEDNEFDTGFKLHRTLQDEIRQYLEYRFRQDSNLVVDLFKEKLNEVLNDDDLIKKGRNKKSYFYNFKKMIELIMRANQIEKYSKASISYKFGEYIYNIGKIEDSIEYYETSLKNDSNTNESSVIFNKIARVLANIGKYDQALEYYHKSLDIETKNSKSKLNYAETLSNIAQIYTYQCKYKEAQKYLEQALQIYRHIHKSDFNLSIGNVLSKIGMNYRYQGDFKKALNFYNQALEIYLKVFDGENDYRIAETYQNIGTILCDQAKYKESLPYYEKSKQVYKEVYDSEETFLYAVVLTNISGALGRLNLNEEAQENSEKSLEIYTKIVKNDDNIKVADAHKNLGLIFLNKGEYMKALELFEKALTTFRRVFAKENDFNLRIAQIMQLIGLVKIKLGSFEEARELLEKSLKIYDKIYESDENLNVAELYDSLGFYYEICAKDFEKSISFFKKSLKIKQQIICDHNHDEILKIEKKLEDVALKTSYEIVDVNGL